MLDGDEQGQKAGQAQQGVPPQHRHRPGNQDRRQQARPPNPPADIERRVEDHRHNGVLSKYGHHGTSHRHGNQHKARGGSASRARGFPGQ